MNVIDESTHQEDYVDILFPMAGQGARFGHTFKPFLTIGAETFIEAAVAPFRPFAGAIGRFVFVYLESQERDFTVSDRLSRMFDGLPIETVRLATPTRGPAETIGRAVEQIGARGPVFICDCDHSLDVEPLFRRVAAGQAFDALLPVWDLERENLASWSVAMVEDDRVLAIAEKRLPDARRGTAKGVIGCYGFADIARISTRARALNATNFSDVIADMLAAGERVEAVSIPSARFFGDPQRLEQATRGTSP